MQHERLELDVCSISEGPCRWRLFFNGPHQTPEFFVGIVEARLRERKLSPRFEL